MSRGLLIATGFVLGLIVVLLSRRACTWFQIEDVTGGYIPKPDKSNTVFGSRNGDSPFHGKNCGPGS